MATKGKKTTAAKADHDVPEFFRMNIEVADLEKATGFYEKLLGMTGRRQAGARVYFECGSVTLQVLESKGKPHAVPKALYFAVKKLDRVFSRARGLRCLSRETVHGAPGGRIAVRPWGEKSFYAEDPWRNPLCFVEAGTAYRG